jgi:hypothetical protein
MRKWSTFVGLFVRLFVENIGKNFNSIFFSLVFCSQLYGCLDWKKRNFNEKDVKLESKNLYLNVTKTSGD